MPGVDGLAKRVAILSMASLSGVGLTLKGRIHFCDFPPFHFVPGFLVSSDAL